MRTQKLTIENPKRDSGYGSDKFIVKAAITIELLCDDDADQARVLFALDTLWRDIYTRLDTLTHNAPLPAADNMP